MNKIPRPIKLTLAFISLCGLIALTGLLSGCSSATTPQSPPTAFDSNIFNVTTNVIFRTNTLIQTNVSFVPVFITNTLTGATVVVTNSATNFVPVTVIIPQTNYVYAPNSTSTATANTVGTTLSAFGVPFGSLVGTALMGVLGLFASFKSRQATTAGTIAGNATQIIQVARNIISTLPNGPAISSQFDTWLIQHQQDANIANEVASVVDTYVDPQDGALIGVAQKLLAQATAPLPAAIAPATMPVITTPK
jgi:hypothetical protein